ncbi:uncharacterized protein EDB91DRAFT_1237718 [Suillus paluster]|uniref:uncharacterized protein n=1 Tax=Suillus paluster TaxID=48578 RepID=UPI001B86919B|nr:uncharacterized protein EDB91DRAFT_1237718 [Suillus paluster]KAG1738676.1 hypothetical protein EDB91DRAFT_1237718 [Suillus paluster]
MRVEEGAALDYNRNYSLDKQEPDCEIEPEVTNNNRWKRNIGCKDCFCTKLCCHDCIVATHTKNPMHQIQEWRGSYFMTISLKKLGLHVQLGHPAGAKCLFPKRAFNDDFTLIDTNGIHEIGLDFCGCETAQTHMKQLLHTAWFPATTTDPRLYPRKDCYEAFMQIVREWQHLKMLKRAGRGYNSASVESTGSGKCAVLCPACPQPGKNLPDNWRDAPKGKHWLYALFVAIDANFRLKRHIVSKDSMDPSLSCSWAYFVEETAYKKYLQTCSGNTQQKSTCSSHNAMNMADSKALHGLAVIGVGTIDCAWHNMKLLNGVGNLQKGERYSNMDLLFFSALRGRCTNTLNVSYDIACQWHKNLWQRMSTMPLNLRLDHLAIFVRFFVPKFHLPAHVLTCQTNFSFNFSKNVGRTDGEAPEHGWSNINPMASSTKEMGPGSRRDVLDDHFGDWNWKKVVGLGRRNIRKMMEAKKEQEAHQTAFQELHKALAPETTEAWTVKVESWEENPNDLSVTNPFKSKVIVLQAVTQAAICLKLTQLEAYKLQEGTDVSLHAEVSPSIFLALGIILENEQRCLKANISKQGLHATDTQMAAIQQLWNALQRKIDAWKCIQMLYTPEVQLLESTINTPSRHMSDIITPEDANLWLPSALCSKSMVPNARLVSTEWELRYAQAGNALEEIRQSLCMHGYIANTRAQNTLSRVEAKTAAAADKYCTAHTALSSLAPVLCKIGWDDTFKVLDRNNDVRRMSAPRHGESEGRRQLPWIWLVEGVRDDADKAIQDGLRLKWCKSRARAAHWVEEVELLQEEMCRVVCFLRWHGGWWKNKVGECALVIASDNESLIAYEGLVAYARCQAQLRHDLADCFDRIWAIHLLPAATSTSMTSLSSACQDHFPDLHLPDAVLHP